MSKTELFLILITISIWVASLKRPFYGIAYFYLYFALLYNHIFSDLRFLRPLFVTPLIALFSLILIQKKKLEFAPQFILISIFFLWMCISRLYNGLDVWAGEEMESFFKLIFFLFLLTNIIDTEDKLKAFIWIMIISYADLSCVARYYDRVSPYFMNKNNFAFGIVGAAVLPAMFVMTEKGILRKLEAVCYLMIIVFSLSGTNSRGCYLGLGVAFVLLLLIDFSFKKILFIVIPVIFVLMNVSSLHWQRFESISVDTEQAGTGGQRMALWSTAVRMMNANPIFGVGSGEHGASFSKYATYEEQLKVGGMVGEEKIKVHNMILQIGSDMGWVGLGLFILIIFLSLRDILQIRRLCKQNDKLRYIKQIATGLGITIIGLLAAGQFANRGYNLQFYTILCLSYCSKMVLLRERTKIAEGQTRVEEPIIPVKWEVHVRTIVFCVFTYISLKL